MRRKLKIGAVLSNVTPGETQPPLLRFDSLFSFLVVCFMQLKDHICVYIVVF